MEVQTTMTRNEFLDCLRQNLAAMSKEDQDAAVLYYEELLDEAEDVEATIAHLGDPAKHAQRILQEAGLLSPPQEQHDGGGSAGAAQNQTKAPFYKSVWFWICMVLALPITLPIALGLGAGALGLAVGILAAILSVIVAIVAVTAATVVAGIALIVSSFYFLPSFPSGFLMFFGGGTASLGVGILFVLAVYGIIRAIKNANRRRREAKAQPQAPQGAQEGGSQA